MAGGNYAVISNSYATGTAQVANDTAVGGLLGALSNGSQDATVATSYSIGGVESGSQNDVGGILGVYYSGTFTDSYWDTTTSGTDNAAGNGKTLPGVTGVTSKQLKSGLPSGFDSTVWAQDKKINNGFPYLIANLPRSD